MNDSPKWQEHFMRQVYLVSSMSKDPSTHIGAITVKDRQVLTTGFNGICRGVNDILPERNSAPDKYLWFEHAERNACFAAAREGIKVRGATMYTQDIPCADCCRAVIQSGITSLVIHEPWSLAWEQLEIHVLKTKLKLTTLMKGRYYPV